MGMGGLEGYSTEEDKAVVYLRPSQFFEAMVSFNFKSLLSCTDNILPCLKNVFGNFIVYRRDAREQRLSTIPFKR